MSFDETHPYITEVRVQHNDAVETELKIKKLTLVSKDNTEKKIDARFTGTDNTKTYKGVVSYNKLWQQLYVDGVAGKKDLAIKVQLKEPTSNIQMCVGYENPETNGADFYPFTGTNEVTFTTKKGVAVKTIGIQYKDESNTPVSVYVNGAWQVEKESVHIGTNGWATYASDCAVNYADLDLQAYAVKLNDDKTSVSFTELKDIVPAHTPVLLKGKADTDYPIDSKSGWAPSVINTDLKVSDGTSASNDKTTLYALSTVNDVTAFYPVKKNSEIPVKRCYLEVVKDASASKAAFYSLGTNSSETTGISSVANKVEKADAPVYNLAGQPVGKGYKGLVIKNGKKFVIK